VKTNTEETEDESSKKHRLRNGGVISLAQLREDYSMLDHLLSKYQCDNFHIQLRTGKTDLMDHAWKKHQIHTADILDVLWDEWDKGKAVEVG